jgi:hypothetical protein
MAHLNNSDVQNTESAAEGFWGTSDGVTAGNGDSPASLTSDGLNL